MNKIKLPSNEVILYALSIGGALTFAYSFLYIDGAATGFMWWLLLARGLVLGAAAGLGMAKISNALPRVPKTFRPYAWGAFGAFLFVTPFIVSPVAYAGMNPQIVAAVPDWLRWFVAVAVGLFVDAITAGVALTSGKLEPESKPEATTSEGQSEPKQPKKQKEQFVCATCGYVAKSNKALSGHQLAHSNGKQKPVAFKLDMTPVDAEGKAVTK